MKRREFLGRSFAIIAGAFLPPEYREKMPQQTEEPPAPKKELAPEVVFTEQELGEQNIVQRVESFLSILDCGPFTGTNNSTPNTMESASISYHPRFDTAERTKEGIEYLAKLIGRVWGDLFETKLPSRGGLPNKYIFETVPPEIITTLILVEHLGYRNFANAQNEEEKMRILRVPLIMLSLNSDHAYNEELSNRDAKGIAQLRQIAYQDACGATAENTTCTNQLLTGSFTNDAMDHEKAVTTMFCLVDHNLSTIPQNERKTILQANENASAKDMRNIGLYSAVAYNAGPSALRNLIREHGSEWQEHAPGDYVERFTAVWDTLTKYRS